MFVKVNTLDEVKGNKLKAVLVESGKTITSNILVDVTSADLPKMQDNWNLYKGVVFNYIGDLEPSRPYSFSTLENKVIRQMDFTTFDDVMVQAQMLPFYMDLVVNLSNWNPEVTLDVRQLQSMCKINQNIRFIGADLLAIEGLNIGYAAITTFSAKATLPPVTNGLEGVFQTFELSELDNVTYVAFKEVKAPRVRAIKAPKEKKEKAPKQPKEPKQKTVVEKKPKYNMSLFNL